MSLPENVFGGLSPYIGVVAAAVLVGSVVTKSLAAVLTEQSDQRKTPAPIVTPAGTATNAPPAKKKPGFISSVLMLVRPVATCAAAITLAAKPQVILSSFLFPALRTSYEAVSIIAALPVIYVTNMQEAYGYGSIAQRVLSTAATLFAGEGTPIQPNATISALPSAFIAKIIEMYDSGQIPMPEKTYLNSLIAEASQLAGRTVSMKELLGIINTIAEQENSRGLVSRLLGIFSFINMMWLISIIGLSIFAMPFVLALSRPFGAFLTTLVVEATKITVRVARYCFYNILVPTYYATRPLIETLFYYISFYFLVEGTRYTRLGGKYDQFVMAGVMTSLTGIILLGFCWSYSLYIRGGQIPTRAVNYFLLNFTNADLLILFGSQAIAHNSSLLGYCAVALFIAQMGFSADFAPLCACVGFQDKQGLIRTAQGCLTTLLCFMFSRAANMGAVNKSQELAFLTPFEPAVSVLATVGYLLALDIAAGINYEKLGAHFLHVGSIVGLMGAGSYLNLPGMTNTASVFAGLYLITLYCSACNPFLGRRNKDATAIWTFGFFLGMYFVAGYLSKNPTVVVNMFTGGMR